MADKIINIVITDEDVRDLAEEFGVDPQVALERAAEWGKYIEATASSLVADQLLSAIESNQP